VNPRRAAQAALGLGLLIALTANLTYAVPKGGVVIGLGLVAPLVLPVVLYLRTTFTADGFWARGLRELAMLLVAGPAVAVSYVHTYELVLGAGEAWILAVLAPLSSDGLAGMATLALHRMRTPAKKATTATPKPKPTPAKPATVAEAVAAQEPREPLHAVGAQPSISAQVRAWIHGELDAGRDVTGADADKQFGLEGSARCGARALAKVLKDRERQAV
jgi:hypothetical protein